MKSPSGGYWINKTDFSESLHGLLCRICKRTQRVRALRNFTVTRIHVLKGGEIRDTKNPQLVAQHCFVASFGRCFRFSPGAMCPRLPGTSGGEIRDEESWRKLLRKVEPGSTLSNKFWFCCSFFIQVKTCRATNLLVPEPINQSARCISSTRNKCFCCGSMRGDYRKN